MKLLLSGLLLWLMSLALGAAIEGEQEEGRHFNFHTENGHQRTEDITYKAKTKLATPEQNEKDLVKAVEYRGGYSFISADGYEYQVLYKANQNGFQPYVTAHKIKTGKELAPPAKELQKEAAKDVEQPSAT